ncbi:Uma2 family endonuclease [Spirosoma fluminis]
MISPEEYLAVERQALDKSEFFNGELIPMAGATRNHNCIKENLSVWIGASLDNSTCQSFSSDMRVHLPETGLCIRIRIWSSSAGSRSFYRANLTTC